MNTKNEIIKQKWKTIISKTNHSFILKFRSQKEEYNHPLIIFYNEDSESIYYLQEQSFDYDKHEHLVNEKKYYKLISQKPKQNSKSKKKQFIYKDTIIDTTLINKCSLDDFIKYFELNEELDYYDVPIHDRYLIAKQLLENHHFKNTIAFKEIKVENNIFKQNFLHIPKNYVDYQLKILRRFDLLQNTYQSKLSFLGIKNDNTINNKSKISGILENVILDVLDELNDIEYDKDWRELDDKITKLTNNEKSL